MKKLKLSNVLSTSFLILVLTACSSTIELETLDASQIDILGRNCAEIYQKQIDAWDSRDAERFRQVYTDDIVHYDGAPYSKGIDPLVDMGWDIFSSFSRWEMRAGDTYISENQCLGTWINWGIFGFTQSDPGLEFDLLDIQNGRIHYWRLFYQQGFFDAFSSSTHIEQEFLNQFASAWSEGDVDTILALYSKKAVLKDSLFGISIKSSNAIKGYIEGILAKSKQADWQLETIFAEKEISVGMVDGKAVELPTASEGGVFTLSALDAKNIPCEIQLVVILTLDDEGKIKAQEMFYKADTLITCDWAEY